MIPVLERSIDLLSAIAESPSGLAAKELILQLGIPQATCYRILRTLAGKNLLHEHGDGRYRVGFGLARMAVSWSGLERHLQEIEPRLRDLTAATGLSGKISVREGSDTVVVLRSESRRPNSITSPVGSKIPLGESGSVGVMLLAGCRSEEWPLLVKQCGEKSRARMLREARAAKKAGIARSYGVHHPSIYAVSKPLDLGMAAAVTLVGWADDFAGGRDTEIEKALAAF